MSASSAPLVSVVIATYNRPEYLRGAIESVANGEYRNVEIVVADDRGSGKRDSTGKSGTEAGPRLRLAEWREIRADKNPGVGEKSRDTGILSAEIQNDVAIFRAVGRGRIVHGAAA